MNKSDLLNFIKNYDYVFIVWSILLTCVVTYLTIFRKRQIPKSSASASSSSINNKNSKLITDNSNANNTGDSVSSSSWLNNCFKWFYFNYDTIEKINFYFLTNFNNKDIRQAVRTLIGYSKRHNYHHNCQYNSRFFFFHFLFLFIIIADNFKL
jgi:hypothetical protein